MKRELAIIPDLRATLDADRSIFQTRRLDALARSALQSPFEQAQASLSSTQGKTAEGAKRGQHMSRFVKPFSCERYCQRSKQEPRGRIQANNLRIRQQRTMMLSACLFRWSGIILSFVMPRFRGALGQRRGRAGEKLPR